MWVFSPQIAYSSSPQPFGFMGVGGTVVMPAMRSDGELQVMLRLLTRHSPPALQPGSYRAVDPYRSAARGVGIPGLQGIGGHLGGGAGGTQNSLWNQE